MVFGLPGCVKPPRQVCVRDQCFYAKVARTDKERSRGLQSRMFLPRDEAMLFIFEKNSLYPFWMRKTLIPLDIIWVDENKKIVFISPNTPPCRNENCPVYTPAQEARYVLEINAGLTKELGIGVGDQVVF
jgi:uncharacterized membrane protein (UPF0127 family)